MLIGRKDMFVMIVVCLSIGALLAVAIVVGLPNAMWALPL